MSSRTPGWIYIKCDSFSIQNRVLGLQLAGLLLWKITKPSFSICHFAIFRMSEQQNLFILICICGVVGILRHYADQVGLELAGKSPNLYFQFVCFTCLSCKTFLDLYLYLLYVCYFDTLWRPGGPQTSGFNNVPKYKK